jgi:threonyl-tRNA synthetase
MTEALDIMRHSAAHVMAQAILRFTIRQVDHRAGRIEDGFYYDIDMDPVSEDDFARKSKPR